MSVGKLQASSLSVGKLKVYEFVENLTGYRICVGTLTPSRSDNTIPVVFNILPIILDLFQ